GLRIWDNKRAAGLMAKLTMRPSASSLVGMASACRNGISWPSETAVLTLILSYFLVSVSISLLSSARLFDPQANNVGLCQQPASFAPTSSNTLRAWLFFTICRRMLFFRKLVRTWWVA